MRFWDSSAVTPLLVDEPESARREGQLNADPVMAVWYGTQVEIESAICRRFREGSLSRSGATAARAKMELLAGAWIELDPTALVRERAMRLLRLHPLRAADAFQLAAALLVFGERPRGQWLLTGDANLREAAINEGFTSA